METMLAVVCKTYEGVKALEVYNREGLIDKNLGLHGFAASIGKPLAGRFHVICLQDIRSGYVGLVFCYFVSFLSPFLFYSPHSTNSLYL